MSPLAQLTKEQKQTIFLAVLLGFGAVYALFRFVLMPGLGTLRESRKELEEIRKKLEQAEQSISKRDALQQQLADVTAELRRCDEQFIPPLENTLSWATEFVNRHARTVGVSVERVEDGRLGNPPPGGSEKTPRYFIPYTVRVTAACGFFEFVKLAEALEKSNPYLFLSEVVIGETAGNALVQRIQFTLEWPIWKDKAGGGLIKGLRPRGGGTPAPKTATPAKTEKGEKK